MNFYNHHIRSIFKIHSISVTFKFCAVLGAQGIRATGFKRAQGNAHCAKFESNTNRMTFEYAPNKMIVKVHPQNHVVFHLVPKLWHIRPFLKTLFELFYFSIEIKHVLKILLEPLQSCINTSWNVINQCWKIRADWIVFQVPKKKFVKYR